jgi:ribosomal protein S27AE
LSTKLSDDLEPEDLRVEKRAAEKSVARAVDWRGKVCPECGSAYYLDGGRWVCGYSPCK